MTETGFFQGLFAGFVAVAILLILAGVLVAVTDMYFDTGHLIGTIAIAFFGTVRIPFVLHNPKKFIFVFSLYLFVAIQLIMMQLLKVHQIDNPASPIQGYYLYLFVAPLMVSSLLGGIMGKNLNVR